MGLRFGVGPELITDYLALIGDKSDNVPGVDKVGPKTAVKWLNEYKNIEGIKKNAESIGGKVGENLRSSIETLDLAHELVKIKIDVPESHNSFIYVLKGEIEIGTNKNEKIIQNFYLVSDNSLDEIVVSGNLRPVSKSASSVPVNVYSKSFFKKKNTTFYH